MKLPIADSKIKTLFFYIFGIYFLFGVHFYSYTLGGYGLYLTNNIIGWILITLLISIGIIQITISGKIYFTKFSKFVLFGILSFGS